MRSPALQEHQATMVTPEDLTATYEDIKGAVAEAIKRGSQRPSLQPKSSSQHR
jgi:hypothetical protein